MRPESYMLLLWKHSRSFNFSAFGLTGSKLKVTDSYTSVIMACVSSSSSSSKYLWVKWWMLDRLLSEIFQLKLVQSGLLIF